MPRIVGLGEAMLRLSAPDHQRLEHAESLGVHVGGAELNSLIGLASLGLDAVWLTRLADNPIGRRIAAHAVSRGVGTVAGWDPDARAPVYFVEHGARPRPSEVLYDRSHSAMAALTPESFAWDAQVRGARAAVTTGITSALGPRTADAVDAFLSTARAAGVLTVFDVNHRGRLWSWDQAAPVLRRTLRHVDVLFASRGDLAGLAGTPELASLSAGVSDEELARDAMKRFGSAVVVLRESAHSAARQVNVRVMAVTAGSVISSESYQADVLDPFGTGDAALAAFLAGYLNDDMAGAVDTAAWACAFQHTIPGDAWSIRASDLRQRGAAMRRILR